MHVLPLKQHYRGTVIKMNKWRCKACIFFHCGDSCECKCHEIHPVDEIQNKSEQESMEGLSSLFG